MGNFYFYFKNMFILFYFFCGCGAQGMFVVASNIFQSFFSFY
jgi:hypothetical protein